jgi:N-acetylglucosaminyldiphosphoundecaprenol N-acetyl-beta-D-mannosaminyltransferase
MGVGGSFDVWAGQKKRAPRWMGALQVEWLYRLIQEPHRWRRMLALPQFALAVLFKG